LQTRYRNYVLRLVVGSTHCPGEPCTLPRRVVAGVTT